MRNSILTGLALLFGTPVVVSSIVVSPSIPGISLPHISHSIPITGPILSITSSSSSGSSSSSSSSSSSASSNKPVIPSIGTFYGDFGPGIAGKDTWSYPKIRLTVPGDYEVTYGVETPLTTGVGENGIYYPLVREPVSFSTAGDYDLPPVFIPARYMGVGDNFVYIDVYDAFDGCFVSGFSLWDNGEISATLPLEKTIVEGGVSSLYRDGSHSVGVRYSSEGCATTYDSLEDNRLPFKKMKIIPTGGAYALGFVKWGQATLRLQNHLSDFSSGSLLGDERIWKIAMLPNGNGYSPRLADFCYYDVGTGLMRDGKFPRAGEVPTTDFFLPPCKTGEEATKNYSFVMRWDGMGIRGKMNLSYSFTVSPSSVTMGGCDDAPYCVEIED